MVDQDPNQRPQDEPRSIPTPEVPGIPPPPPGQGSSTRRWVLIGLGGCGVLILLLLLLVGGCAALFAIGGSEDSKSKTKSDASKEEEQATSSSEAPAPINLSGNGQSATDPFELQSGLAVFRMTYQGERNFIVNLLDQNGARVGGSLANVIGSFEGSQAVQTRAGQHVLDVQASGPWTITIEQPRPADAPQTTSFDGNGKTTTDFFQLSKGLKRFELSYRGERNFIVNLLDKNGAQVGGTLVNEIGSFSGSKAVQVTREDIYLLQVEASGPWSIQVE